METMNAAVRYRYGSPEELELIKLSKPTPKEDEILVRVVTSSATAADTMIRKGEPRFGRLFLGLFKPAKPITGTGFAGIVERIGADVSNFSIEDRVFGETGFNFSSNAEYIVVSEKHLVSKMPNELSFEEATPICDGALTSWNFLTNIFKLKASDKILINGASGSLGTAAIQIAKYLGAEVTAVCSSANTDLVTNLGATFVIDYKNESFIESTQKFDVIFDTIGKSSFTKCKPVLKNNGAYLSPVLSKKLLLEMVLTSGRKKGPRALFSATGSLPIAQLRGMIADVVGLIEKGDLKITIDKTFPLRDICEAHRYIETGRKRGNVVLLNE
jgi:NADPH:quinone reductase-like Zn-dependent oxidoreductase